MTHLEPHVAQTIAALEAAYPTFAVEPRHWPVWNQMIGEFEPGVLANAVQRIIDSHTHGVPGIPQIRQAILGLWSYEMHPGCDNFGAISPDNPKRGFHILRDATDKSIRRVFSAELNLLEWPSQKKLAWREKVIAEMRHLLPPSERERLERPADYLAPKVDFQNRLNGLLGQ